MLKFIPVSIIFISVISLDAFSVGMEKNQLSACPDKPNCVYSMSTDPAFQIEPFRYTGNPKIAKKLLIKIINNLPRTNIVNQDEDYLHTTFTSMIFRFVDDVAFLFVDKEKLIHVRSASRVGHSDFGVNRKRVEMLRIEFNNELSVAKSAKTSAEIPVEPLR